MRLEVYPLLQVHISDDLQYLGRERRGSGSGDMFGTLDLSALAIMLTTLMDFVGLSRMDTFDI
jgi:hypothetical protein